MNTQEILGVLALVLVVTGGVWGTIKMLLIRDRTSQDNQAKEAARLNEEARATIWKRLDELRADMTEIQVEQGVLRERVRTMPDHDALHAKLEAIEERLERRLDNLVKQVQEAFQAATAKFRCPYDSEHPGG